MRLLFIIVLALCFACIPDAETKKEGDEVCEKIVANPTIYKCHMPGYRICYVLSSGYAGGLHCF